VVALLAVTFSLVLVFGTVLVLHEYVISMSRVKSLVNINGEANLPAWWNSVLLLMIGIGARGSAGRSWRPGSGSRPSPGWFRASSSRLRCSSCWSPSDGLPQPTRRGLLIALVCYLGGAIGVEAVNDTLRGADRLIYDWVGTTIEETVEMVSCIIAIGIIARRLAERLDHAMGLNRARTLEVVGHGLSGSGDGPDPDPGAIRRIVQRGRPQDQVPVRR
jgi:hypothetical protein